MSTLLIEERALRFGLFLCLALLSGARQEQPTFAPPPPSAASLDANGIPEEYRRPFEAAGVNPDWSAHIRLGQVDFTLAGQPTRRIELLTPSQCITRGCEGVMIEQKVWHGHHGVSINKEPCQLAGSTRSYPYRISVSVLRSADDRTGVTYVGCGWQASPS